LSLVGSFPGLLRRAEPVTIGIPLPPGAVTSAADLVLRGNDGSVRPLQARSLDTWPDRSLRWVLLDFTADLAGGVLSPLHLSVGERNDQPPARGHSIVVRETSDGVDLDTGVAVFGFRRGQSFPLSSVILDDGGAALDSSRSGFHVASSGVRTTFVVAEIDVHERGPIRAEMTLRAVAKDDGSAPVEVSARVECFAGTATLRVALSLCNPRRARHTGGEWTLGDSQSALLDFASLVLAVPEELSRLSVTVDGGQSPADVTMPFELYQESSGGEHWDHSTHVNRNGKVPLTLRGYRLKSGQSEHVGLRASPTVVGECANGQIALAIPEFWERCPRALSVEGSSFEVGLLPRQFADLHEIQGGERTTHTVVVAFGRDTVSDPPLAWCHEPLRIYPSAAWCCGTGAVRWLTVAAEDEPRYQSVALTALDPVQGFLAKRERFDEYGWRHFGDVPADHESVRQPPDRPFVSHYNNQYDALAVFSMQFLRSGDARWWRLMDELARHVRDIDIYHTTDDKAAYNGGLFWHTQHYTDAGTSTHRTYPKGSIGGGPSAEHNYTIGLMLHYFLTGDRASRDAAVGLGRWVLDMDDGRLTVFRWLTSGPTGLASATGAPDYHGPGRGAANSILACLVARCLTGDRVFADKADELIRRCIHPADDVSSRNLLDVERRWYYTVFLQALGEYLGEKAERGENDEMYAYGQSSLLCYARWMAAHEVPYLSRPQTLEFPTETWAAQDLRKSEVFWWAAGHTSGAERQQFVERARFFYDDAMTRLTASPTRHFTRPLVLSLRNAMRTTWFESALAQGYRWPHGTLSIVDPPSAFEPQRERALRRAGFLAAGFVTLVLASLLVAAF
jgi:hypothetical protein